MPCDGGGGREEIFLLRPQLVKVPRATVGNQSFLRFAMFTPAATGERLLRSQEGARVFLVLSTQILHLEGETQEMPNTCKGSGQFQDIERGVTDGSLASFLPSVPPSPSKGAVEGGCGTVGPLAHRRTFALNHRARCCNTLGSLLCRSQILLQLV